MSAGLPRIPEGRTDIVLLSNMAKSVATEAAQQRDVAKAINSFMNAQLFGRLNPAEGGTRNLTVVDLVKQVSASIPEAFHNQPEVEAEVSLTIGNALNQLGEGQAALKLLQRSEELFRESYGEDSLQYANALRSLAQAIYNHAAEGTYLGSVKRALSLSKQALRISEKALGPDDPLVLRDKGDVAMFDALSHGQLSAGLDPNILAMLATVRGKGETVEEVRAQFEDLILWCDRRWALGDRDAVRERLLAEFEPFLAQPLLMPRVPYAAAGFAQTLAQQGQLGAAEALADSAISIGKARLSETHPYTLFALKVMGKVLLQEGKWAEAVPYYQDVLEKEQKVLGKNSSMTLFGLAFEGTDLWKKEGKLAQAEPYFRMLLEIRRRNSGADNLGTLLSVIELSDLLTQQEKSTEAQAIWLPVSRVAEAKLAKLQPQEQWLGRDLVECVAKLYDAWQAAEPDKGYDTKAAEWRTKLAGLQATTQPETSAATSTPAAPQTQAASAPSPPP